MTGVVPVFIFLEEASIYTLLDVALDLVDLVLWGLVRTPSYHRPSNFGLGLRSILTRFLQDTSGCNTPKTSWYICMSR